MLKKKILGGLILASFIVGITQATYVDITPNQATTVGNSTVTCDEYFNCTSTWGNNEYNGLAISPNEFKSLFWNNNGYLSMIYYYTNRGNSTVATFEGTGINVKKVSYTEATNYNRDSCDYLSNPETLSRDTFIETYKGKQITKYHKTYPNDMAYGCLCLVYNETDGGICIQTIDGLGNPGNKGYYSVNGNYGLTNSFIPSDIQNLSVYSLSPLTAGGPDTEGGPISCINIKTQIMLYGNKYNTGMCYTNGLYFSGFTPIQTGKLSIFEVFPSYQDYQNMANTYNTYCHAPYTQEYCAEAMSGYNEGMQFFTTIENANINNNVFTVEAEKLYQYCHLQLNFTEEQKLNECKETVDNYYATGVSEDGSNGNPFEGITDRLEDNIQIAVPTTGTVFDEFLDGDTRIVGITDRFGNFKDIYHKIMGLFKYRNTQQGIIPGYITAMIMLILLLAIIKK